jgi:4-hydroxy-2-oxoglutarate aldolase
MFEGVYPPMATPFAAGEVDAAAITSNVEKWVRSGVRGVVALGSNGEAPLLDDAESDRVVGTAREALPADRLLIAGTGRESTRATVAASRRAAQLGADCVLVRTPFYFKTRMTADALVHHYTAVADESPVPVLLYNYPALTGVNLAVDVVARLASHPNIAGMKETGSDTGQVADFVNAASSGFAVIAGSAPTFYASLCVGARGGILAIACVVPDLCVMLFDEYRAGRVDSARELQRKLTPMARLVTTVHGVPGLKAAMDLVGYEGGEPRAPLMPCGDEAVAQIRRELANLNVAAAVNR